MQFSFSGPKELLDILNKTKPANSSLSEYICERLMASYGISVVNKIAILSDFSDPFKVTEIAKLGVRKISGVYALIESGQVIYIGSSRDIRSRLMAHKSKGFTHFQYLKTKNRTHPIVEQKYISLVRPKLNSPVTFDRTVGKDGRIYYYR